MLCQLVLERGHPPFVFSCELIATVLEQQRVVLPKRLEATMSWVSGVPSSNHKQLRQQFGQQLATNNGNCCQTSQQVSNNLIV